jgi:vancomycin resistance protein YoaR
MSRLNKYILIAILVLAPKFAGAKVVSFGDKTWTVTPQTQTGVQQSAVRGHDLKNLTEHVLFNRSFQSSYQILDLQTIGQIAAIQTEVNQPVSNAQLEIKDGWATTFVPDKDGRIVDLYKLLALLSQISDTVTLPVAVARPQTKLADLNDLGIDELVAVGQSVAEGSSKNRLINVTVGSSKYNGLILQPGEEFSFNKYLGDVDAAHGFKPEQVIKSSGIELEFGGGLCQVSTTMFRAAMNAGMPITVRRNHSFAVHYYSPQGTDATIYPGVSDLKFINNFSSPILVRTYVEGINVTFEMYGKKDDRVVTFEGPIQYDKKPDGSMKATWTRHVTLNGETTTYVAKSNYVSPNLFKKVDVAAIPNPQATPTPANAAATTTLIPNITTSPST